MVESKDYPQRIPADQAGGCEAWQMPALDDAAMVVTAFSKRRSGHDVKPVSSSSKVEPLTASKIESLREQAYQEGLDLGKREGYQAGMQQAKAEVDATLMQLNRMLGQLMHPLAGQQKELEGALVNLAMAIAKSVVNCSVEVDEQRLMGVINQVLAQLPDASEHIRVIVHPRDAELLRLMPEQVTEWKIIADASLVSGGCIVKTDHSYVDFTLDKQFQLTVEEMVKQRLLAVGRDESPESDKAGDQ